MIVLDTHVWWWMVMEPGCLSQKARELLSQSEETNIAAVSLLEIVMLERKGRIIINTTLDEWFKLALIKSSLNVLPLDYKVAIESYSLPGNFHKDPSDRQIVATSRIYGATLVTKDDRIRDYPYVNSVW